ncbi:MmgE/PrpD family protein [Actinophytocola oryzae]|uniref:2-methylcitrate dehydratase PrpD n=1 Tax=Actinophytocola oryzae TaxID=502181 RepID=A0A4R7W562_9PSEU|nr:MmgE/PrpD family protein [Actinophytocola oryzae]TDV57744.1 2-methylcitrate dehydratase PrpD [Actinophytocola oryzae]
MAATGILSDFVAAAGPVPDESRAVAELSRLDTLCAAAAGTHTPSGATIGAFADELGTAHGPWLAWRTSALAGASGMDDTAAFGAAGAPVWGALCAAAGTDEPGTAGLDAFAIGVHAASALWRASRYREAERGFAGTSVFGTVAAAVACAVLFGHDQARVTATLAVAASSAGGLIANHGTTAALTHAGNAARDGLVAARLAEGGYHGATDVLESRQGFGEAFAGLSRAGFDDLETLLHQPIRLGSAVRTKLVPGHVDQQRVVRAAHELARHGVVRRFTVVGVPAASEGSRFDVPATVDEALLSLRYALACVLRDGGPALGDLTEERVADPLVRKAMDHVRVDLSPRWRPEDAEARTVLAEYADGTTRGVDIAELPVTASAVEVAGKWRSAREFVADGTLDTYIDRMDQCSTVKL